MIEPQRINFEPFVEAISKSDAFAYPTPYLKQWVMKDRSAMAIRLIHPEDEPMMVKFHETLSMNSVYSRYFYYMKLNTRTKHHHALLADLKVIVFRRTAEVPGNHAVHAD